jgi:hypothetical protein
MSFAPVAKPGPSMDMSKTEQQSQDAAPAKAGARKDWELFWRIIAGLMLLVIAWVVWVLYQITPRSVVTPLAYASKIRPIANMPAASEMAPTIAPADTGAPPALPPAAEAAAPEPEKDQGQAAVQSGQSTADAQTKTGENMQDRIKPDGLRLATEISAPPTGNPRVPQAQVNKPGGAAVDPAARGGAEKDRP